MTVDNNENLIINIGGKTQCISRKDIEKTFQEPKTFCANYNRDNEEMVKDSIVEEVRTDLLRRSQLGINKYGVFLSREDVDLKGWLQHAYEEALDMANYLKRSIKELEK